MVWPNELEVSGIRLWYWQSNGTYIKYAIDGDGLPIYHLPSRVINLWLVYIVVAGTFIFKKNGKWVMRADKNSDLYPIEKFEDQATPIGKWMDYSRLTIWTMVKEKQVEPKRSLRWFVNDFLRASAVLQWTEALIFVSFIAIGALYYPNDDILSDISFTLIGIIIGTSIHFVISYVTLVKNISD